MKVRDMPQIMLRLTPEEKRHLKATATGTGLSLNQLIREELAPLTQNEGPLRVRLRRWRLRDRLAADEEWLRVLDADLARSEHAIRTARTHLPAAARQLLDQDLEAKRERCHELRQRITDTRNELTTMTPHPPAMLALAAPIALAAAPTSPWGLILIATAVGGAAIYAFPKGRAWMQTQFRRITGATPNPHDATGDAHAPSDHEVIRMSEIVTRFRHDPRYLNDHLTDFVRQPNGLELLRRFGEDNPLNRLPDAVRILACTPDEYAALPEDVKLMLASQRTLDRRATQAEDAGEEPPPVQIKPGPNGKKQAVDA